MKIAFVLDDIIHGHEPLGVTTLAALLIERGHAVEYFSLEQPQTYRDVVQRVKAFGPRIVGYSSSTGVHRHYAEFNRLYRQADPAVFSIMGGPHPSFFPEFLDEHRDQFDAICVGEGEGAMIELVEALDDGRDHTRIANLRVVLPDGSIQDNPTRPFVQDLDALPFPDHTFASRFPHLKDNDTGYIMAGRGCPFSCSFCFNHVSQRQAEGAYVRFRSPDRVIEELRELKEAYGKRFISFQDDTLTLDRDWFINFADHYAKAIALPFMAHIRADRIDEAIADALARAGCVRACMGLETGSDHLRASIMAKKVTSDQIRQAAELVTSRGIELATQNLFGVPEETVATTLQTISLNIECRTGLMILNFLQPYPKTRIAEMARERGLWDGDVDDIQDSAHSGIVLDIDNKDTIESVAKLSYLLVDYPWIHRLAAPAIRWLDRRGARRALNHLIGVLSWWDKRLVLTPLRGYGVRYHRPPCLRDRQLAVED